MKFNPKVINIGNLKVVLVKDNRQSVTVRAILGSGSREELDKEAGSAHFLEHFVFKGTKKYPGMYDFKEAIEKVGGSYNAYTGVNEMCFWVKMSKSKFKLAVELVSELLQNPTLPKEHFDRERGTILEELKMYQDYPDSKAADNLQKIMYGKTNLGRPIIGTVESLNSMTVKDLSEYHKKWFVSKNIIIGIVGNYGTDDEALDIIKANFNHLINDKTDTPIKDIFKWDTQNEPRKILTSRKLDQANVYMGFRGLSLTEHAKDKEVLKVINTILGRGSISRLFKEVRENRGWAYHISSGFSMMNDVGSVLIGAGLPKNELKDATKLILDISYGLSGGNKWKITNEEIEIAKETLKGRLDLAFDKPEVVLGNALDDLMFENTIYTPQQIKKDIDAVKLDNVKDICDMIFRPENLSISVVGDYKKLDLKL